MSAAWKEKTLSSVLKLEYGKPLEKDYRKSDGLYPAYGANGEKARTDKYYHDKPSIIVGRKGSAGEINLTAEKFWPLDVTYFVTFDKKNYDLRFLFYLLTTLNLPSLAKGVKPGINRNDVYSKRVKIPPIEEQKRIVSIIDESFEAIDIAKANTEKNLQNARALFESELDRFFERRGENWKEDQLGQISKINYGYTESASHEAVGPKFLRITDIQDNQVNWNEVPYCKIESSELHKYLLSDGDIVFARTGATTGKSYLVRQPPKSVFASYLIRVQLDSNIVQPSFLNLFFQTSVYWNSVKLGSSGSAQGGFNASKLKDLVIPHPIGIEEQLSFVNRFETLSISIRQLESTYQKKLTALKELKKSLLHQAFSGGL